MSSLDKADGLFRWINWPICGPKARTPAITLFQNFKLSKVQCPVCFDPAAPPLSNVSTKTQRANASNSVAVFVAGFVWNAQPDDCIYWDITWVAEIQQKQSPTLQGAPQLMCCNYWEMLHWRCLRDEDSKLVLHGIEEKLNKLVSHLQSVVPPPPSSSSKSAGSTSLSQASETNLNASKSTSTEPPLVVESAASQDGVPGPILSEHKNI